MKFSKIVAATALAAGSLAPVALIGGSAAPASAQSNCSAGTWGTVYGWGDCRGSGKWQLLVSCTWGGSGKSGVITGPGHVDVKCSIGSARSASIIFP